MKKWLYRHKIKLSIATILLVWYAMCLPDQLFDVPYSTVITSSDGRLLDAHIARDEQWRFPAVDSIPYKYEQCVLQYEDASFYSHPGFNPVSMVKAMSDNISAGEIVRGGSTITQQVIRLSRKSNRTYLEKFIELIWATRLELRHSKKEILELYASHAPYGGNVIGLDMASWRYFGRQPHELSWAESATLAVLPNAPGLIYPGKREHLLKQKRNVLLLKLKEEGIINAMDYELAISESVPTRDFRVPQLAPHLLQRANKEYGTQKIKTTIDYELQNTVASIVKNHHDILKQNGIHNLAMVVMDVRNLSVSAYVGNSPTTNEHGKDVDIITAPRSTGSVLKPFLYAAMLDHGELLPHSIVKDVPTTIAGFNTQNFDKTYSGAIPASQALARSLNVPAVRMLRDYTVPRFYQKLQDLKQSHLNRGSATYGLSLIIGGGESSLWDMCHAYLAMASSLQDFTITSSEYDAHMMQHLSYVVDDNSAFAKAESKENKSNKNLLPASSLHDTRNVQLSTTPVLYGAGSIYKTFEAMATVNRPEGEEIWHFFNPDQKIAWKTGTSWGNRDAWAIGVTPDYVIGVWTGNADGEGRAEMTGIKSAAPVLFDLFNRLPDAGWFAPPYDDMIETEVCSKSGYLATPDCPKTQQWIPAVGERFDPCPYHELIQLDTTERYQVTADCEPVSQIVTRPYFNLPPVMAWYYSRAHPDYESLPSYRSDCNPPELAAMRFIKPTHGTVITNTIDVNGVANKTVIELAHREPETTVYWYVDGEYITSTTNFHEIAINASRGSHIITATDEDGNDVRMELVFE